MSEVKRYGVVTTWDGTTKIGSHIEEFPDGIYMLVADHTRDIKALETRIEELEADPEEIELCCQRQAETITRLRWALSHIRHMTRGSRARASSIARAALTEGGE